MGIRKHALLIGVSKSQRISLHPCIKIRRPYKSLKGCENDLELMRGLLVGTFGFPEESVRILNTEEASRGAILAAVDELAGRAGPDDVVVIYYSGHASRLIDADDATRAWESIVPNDATRRGFGDCKLAPQRRCADSWSFDERRSEYYCGPFGGVSLDGGSRDIFDLDICGWVDKLNEKTPNLTLIFDCCHADSMSRDLSDEAVREVAAERRPASEVFGGDRAARFASLAELPRIRSGWLPVGRHAVVVAACRAVELSWERKLEDGYTTHGTLTYHLARALADLGPGATWRDVLERVAPEVAAERPSQHPQIEGEIDQRLFSTEKVLPEPYVAVAAVAGGEVELWAGIAHGVVPGSLWTLRPHGTRSRREGEELARVRIEQLRPVTSRGRVVAAPAGALAAGQRAFLLEQDLPRPGLQVAIAAPEDRLATMAERVRESKLLALVEGTGGDDAGESAGADVTVHCLAPRETAGEGDPCRFLGPLEEWTWAVTGGDGRSWARPRPDDEAGVRGVAGDLVKLARFGGLRRLTNPDPESRLRGRVDLEILHQRAPGQSLEAAPQDEEYGMAVIDEGGNADFEIANRHDADVWVSLVGLDCDYSVTVLMPRRGFGIYVPGGEQLQPGQVLRVGRDYFRATYGFPMSLPEGFPWPAAGGASQDLGVSYFKLLVTLVPAKFEFLEQEGTRFEPRHPLEGAVWLYHSNLGTRTMVVPAEDVAQDEDWTVVTRTLALRRNPSHG